MKTVDFADKVRAEIGKAVVGQDQVITEVIAAFLSQGHVLLEGVPGIAKTLLAKSLATALGIRFKRIQFTPDLMPSDVTGVNVYDIASGQFSLRHGPVFTDILLADEVNRTPPKTQSALLQAMEERTVTIDGDNHPLTEYFFVIATQNPVEFEGTYPLPEAQLDRFTMKALVDYPNHDEEVAILTRSHEGFNPQQISVSGVKQACDVESIVLVIEECKKVTVSEEILRYIAALIRTTRESPLISLGASPRAGVALLGAAKSLAAIYSRDYVIPDDIQQMAKGVLRHRLILRPESVLDEMNADNVIEQILAEVPVPR